MIGAWVAAGAAVLSFIGVIVNVVFTVRGNRSTAREIVNLQSRRAEYLERTKQRHQLSLAALERRLEVHQEAYALWWRLSTVAHDDDDGKRREYVLKCEDWWVKNCLYLDAEARYAFRGAYFAALEHKVYKDARDSDLIRQNWEAISAAGDAIVKGVELPSWGKDEYKPISN